MKRLISIALSLLIALPAQATTISISGAKISGTTFKTLINTPSRTLNTLLTQGDLSIYKDFSDGTLTPDYLDAPLGTAFTFSSAYDATHPATYASDAVGTITTTTTNNTPRFAYGLWNNTGFVNTGRGLLIDGAQQNILYPSNQFGHAYWTKTGMTVASDSVLLPDGTSGTSNTLVATTADSAIYQPTALGSATRSLNVWLKRKTGNGDVQLSLDNSIYYTTVPVDSSWKMFSTRYTNASPKSTIRIKTAGDEVYAYGIHTYGAPYFSSYVPTGTGASLAKTADVLSIPTSGVINSDQSTVIMQFVTLSDENQNGSTAAVWFDSGANSPKLTSAASTNFLFKFYPNQASGTSLNTSDAAMTAGNTFTVAAVSYGASAGTNSEVYVNGTLQTGTSTNTTNYTAPTMGSNIYFGSNYSSLYQPAIILKKIVIYRQALTPTQIATVNAAMSGNWESLIDTRPRILTVGDSITQGTGETNSWGWRQGLQTALGVSVTWSPTSNYRLYGNYNFVGPYRTPSKDDFYQVNHAGVSGQRVDQMYDRLPTHLRNFMTGAPAGSIVLIHAGTNDVTSGTTATALTDIPLMIDQIYAFNPSIKIYVALIIPRTDANDAATTTYNTSLRSALVTKQTTVPTLHIVDMNTAFKANANWAADYLPAGSPWLYVHPNDAGYAVMTNTWASCIASSTNTYCDGH